MAESLHTEGYHGTTVDRARTIQRRGFRPHTAESVFFAPVDNLFLAQWYGRAMAYAKRKKEYAVIRARFPATPLTRGPNGYEIKITAEQSSVVEVLDILFFETMGDRRVKK